jgi:hypothetical protein
MSHAAVPIHSAAVSRERIVGEQRFVCRGRALVHDAFRVTDEERVVTKQETVEVTSRNWSSAQATNRNWAVPADPPRMLAIAWALIGILLTTSASIVLNISRLIPNRCLPSDAERAGMAPPDEALRRQWTESTKQLCNASSDDDRLLLVGLRAQVLDDIVDRRDRMCPGWEASWSGQAPFRPPWATSLCLST